MLNTVLSNEIQKMSNFAKLTMYPYFRAKAIKGPRFAVSYAYMPIHIYFAFVYVIFANSLRTSEYGDVMESRHILISCLISRLSPTSILLGGEGVGFAVGH